jgi:predicted ATP-dependent endonuclease of OLD family
MVMLQKLEISNFRGIRKGSLELSPLTILLGPNNSGKSAILEALFLIPNPLRSVPYVLRMEGEPNQRSSYNRALDAVSFLHESLEYRGYAFLPFNYTAKSSEISCLEDDRKYRLRFLMEGDHIFLSTNAEIENTQMRKFNGVDAPVFGSFYSSWGNIDARYERPWMKNTLLVSSDLTRLGFAYLKSNWTKIANSRVLKTVARNSASLSADKYIDFTLEPFLGQKLELQAYFKNGKRIRLGDIGEGIKNYIVIRMLYETTAPDTLLWDDIESHLNPRILLHLANWFGDLIEKKKQVVISTHSLEAAKIMAGINEEESSIYMTSLDNNRLRTKRLTVNDLENLEKFGIDARASEALLF